MLSKESAANSQILLLLLKGFIKKLYGCFYSCLSVKQEKATNNNNNNNNNKNNNNNNNIK